MLLSSQVSLPICIANTPADPQFIYVCERTGAIRVLDKDTGVLSPGAFLDISPVVSTDSDNGLLALAFDPNYAANGFFYINYNTLDGHIVLARYHATPGAHTADPASAYTILRYTRQLGHNGGWIGFSPANRYLYITSGDGDLGGTYDIGNHAQTIVNERLGKIFRIDPRSDDFPNDPDRNYHIPVDNPFVGSGADDEIWSYGVRNPWRASFDRASGDFYFGDVGMDTWEEINFESAFSPGARNYGWPCMEATHCTDATACTCNDPALALPIFELPHPTANAITGGYVYRGQAIPELFGTYFFGDFLRHKVWSFNPHGQEAPSEIQDWTDDLTPPGTTMPISYIAAFGEDADGELYICSIFTNKIYKLVPYPCLPVVDVNPVPQNRSINTTIILPVIGAGADPLTFQWQKNGIDIADDARISGSDTPTLTITDAQFSDAGDYTAILTSPCGSTSTTPVALTIFSCPSADYNHNMQVNVQDIFDFLAGWFSGDAAADFNHTGGLNVQDIFEFLDAWFRGCA